MFVDPSGHIIVPPWLYRPPDPRYQPGFKLCQRNLAGDDWYTWAQNQAGGQHTYIQYGPVDPTTGKPQPGTQGVGGAGTPGLEEAFNPNSCVQLCRSTRTLRNGVGAGKRGDQANHSEIINCLVNTRWGRPYSFYKYNCRWWATNRGMFSCGLTFCSGFGPVFS